MLAFLFVPSAAAACAVEQNKDAEGVEIVVRALEEPVGCRTVTLESDRPLALTASIWTPEGRRVRVKGEHLRALPGGGWEIGLPELEVGGFASLDAGVAGDSLTVRLGAAEPPPPPATAHEVRTLTLDARHPGWGFADPARASTRVELQLTFAPDTVAQLVPLPAGATDIDAGGLSLVPLGVSVPAGTAAATVRYTIAGAEPLGARTIPAGSLTLVGPGVEWVASSGPGVTRTAVEGGIRFDAPEGGVARWRVARAGGAAVVPDVGTYVAGLEWRFARQSLPEPAVPVSIRDRLDRPNLFQELVAEVKDLRRGGLPGRSDPLRTRQLNVAWRSGWVTPLERALILHRFLGQEKFLAGWVLTGEDADLTSLTGFDTMLLTVQTGGETVWVDPECRVCAPGEIGTRWLGRPAIGAASEVPTAPGRLTRSLTLAGDQFRATFSAVGAAALWVRERIDGVEPGVRSERLGAALGMPGATLVATTGFAEAGAPLTVTLVGSRPPQDPFGEETPWTGGWGDGLETPEPSP
ncbi:MAG: hypothetical protein Q8P41_06680 [Pseudomonadota bacterium]|nr:hypothetical protein [Pseudomonadota bacterium]